MPDNLPPQSAMILYQTEDGRTRIQCRFEGETIWLTQKLMAELFNKDVRTINQHIQNFFAEGELAEESVIRKFRITAADGKGYETQHYNLEVVRVHINSNFDAKQQAFLDFVLSHYVNVGVEELNQDKLRPLLLIKYHNSIQDAVADLGHPEQIGQVFAGFQKYLYQLAPVTRKVLP